MKKGISFGEYGSEFTHVKGYSIFWKSRKVPAWVEEKEIESSKRCGLFHRKEDSGYDSSNEDENEEGEEESPSRNVAHGYHTTRGKMGHGMEGYVAAGNRKISGHERGLYAIFYGHSGRDVAEYLQSHPFDNISSPVLVKLLTTSVE